MKLEIGRLIGVSYTRKNGFEIYLGYRDNPESPKHFEGLMWTRGKTLPDGDQIITESGIYAASFLVTSEPMAEVFNDQLVVQHQVDEEILDLSIQNHKDIDGLVEVVKNSKLRQKDKIRIKKAIQRRNNKWRKFEE